MSNWVDEEFEDVDFGDVRLNSRGTFILKASEKIPGASIPQIFKSWAETKACYRFFSNPKITAEKILHPHINSTIKRISEEKIVFLVNDTSSLDYTKKKAIKGKGRLSANQNGNNLGVFLHPLIAITPDRQCLGIVDGNIFTRSLEKSNNSREEKKKRPIEEKEIFRWIESYNVALSISQQTPDTKIIYMGDREADFIDLINVITKARDKSKKKNDYKYAEAIVRCSQIERLVEKKDSEFKENERVFNTLKKSPNIGEIEFNLPKTEKRPMRKVIQSIKANSITFKQTMINGKKISKIKLNAVMAIEENPPEGEEAVCWILFTTLPISTFEEAALVVQYYLCRWEIEIFFKILKSGCKVEERQLEDMDNRLIPMIALFLIVAWRILYLIKIGRTCPNLLCTDVFEDAEWMSVYRILFKNKPLPTSPPTMEEFIIMVAKLGGYLGREKDPPPGPKVMWKGLTRMADFTLAWEAFGPASNVDTVHNE